MLLSRERERQLIQEIQKAEKARNAATEILFKAYDRNVRVCAQALVRSGTDSENYAAEAWQKFWAFIRDFDPDKSSVIGFLRRLVRNAIADRPPAHDDQLDQPDDEDNRGGLGAADIPSTGPSPHRQTQDCELHRRLLLEAFRIEVPPHQRIVFGLVKLLEWKPSEIVDKLSPEALDALAGKLEADYARIASLRLEMIRPLFDALQTALRGPVDWEHFRHPIAGYSLLQEYFTNRDYDKKKQNISQWADFVKQRLTLRLARLGRAAGITEGGEQ